MAHSTALAALVGELVASLGPSELPARDVKRCRDSAARAVRTHQHARTNQFDVQKSLAGLSEKFQILGREDLADALDARLRLLSDRSDRWTPEVLALLLRLSDRPSEKTDLASLERLRKPQVEAGLTWAQIIKDDPFDETDDVWRDVDYAAHGSSDEDEFEALHEEEPADTPASSVDESYVEHARSYVVHANKNALQEVKDSQQRLAAVKLRHLDEASSKPASITELMLIRECIMMLRGLPTTLFTCDNNGKFTPVDGISLSQTSSRTVMHNIGQLAALSNSIQQLRSWSERQLDKPLLRTFQTCVRDRLYAFSRHLTDLELPLMRKSRGALVSIAKISSSICDAAETLLALHQLVSSLSSQDSAHRCLTSMHERLCLAQLAGEQRVFMEVGTIFSRCLSIYLRPIRAWMNDGILGSGNDDFFITEQASRSHAGDPSFDRFAIKLAADGNPDAPAFLHGSCRRVLNAGRSVKLIRALDGDHGSPNSLTQDSEAPLNAIKGIDPDSMLEPFSEYFSKVLLGWVVRHHAYSSTAVKLKLVEHCGLWRSLDALEYLYLARDGSLTGSFVEVVAEKIDRCSPSWNDRFFITDLLQDVYKHTDAVDPDCIVATPTKCSKGASKLQKLASMALTYRLHWSTHVILRASSLDVYQKLFSLTLQLNYLSRKIQSSLLNDAYASTPVSTHRLAGTLRFRMMRFISVLQDYIGGTIIDTQTVLMRRRLADAEDIEEMAAVHADYISRLETQAILGKNMHAIRAAVMQALELCLAFCEMRSDQQSLEQVDESSRKRRRRRGKSAPDLDDESDDDHDDDNNDDDEVKGYDEGQAHSTASDKHTGPVHERLGKMDREFARLNTFMINGLRGVVKAGADPAFVILAERLE